MGYQQGFNEIGMGNVYPESSDSMGLLASSPIAQASGREAGGEATQQLPANMLLANPITGGIVLVVMLLIIGFIVHRFGKAEGDFSNLKASFYNVVVIALVAVTGIPLVKAGFVKLADIGVPGAHHIASYVLAA